MNGIVHVTNIPKNPRKSPWPAVAHQLWLIERYLRHYAADDDFIRDLTRFAEKHHDALDVIVAMASFWGPFRDWDQLLREADARTLTAAVAMYVSDFQEFAVQHRLDWLRHNSGLIAVHRALVEHQERKSTGWLFLTIEAHELPHVEGVDYSGRYPSVRLFNDIVWGPESQGLKAVRKELRAATRGNPDAYTAASEKADRIIANYVAAGYVFPPDSMQLDMHLGWLFRRVVKKHPVDWISSDFKLHSSTVQQTTKLLRPYLSSQRIPHPSLKR